MSNLTMDFRKADLDSFLPGMHQSAPLRPRVREPMRTGNYHTQKAYYSKVNQKLLNEQYYKRNKTHYSRRAKNQTTNLDRPATGSLALRTIDDAFAQEGRARRRAAEAYARAASPTGPRTPQLLDPARLTSAAASMANMRKSLASSGGGLAGRLDLMDASHGSDGTAHRPFPHHRSHKHCGDHSERGLSALEKHNILPELRRLDHLQAQREAAAAERPPWGGAAEQRPATSGGALGLGASASSPALGLSTSSSVLRTGAGSPPGLPRAQSPDLSRTVGRFRKAPGAELPTYTLRSGAQVWRNPREHGGGGGGGGGGSPARRRRRAQGSGGGGGGPGPDQGHGAGEDGEGGGGGRRGSLARTCPDVPQAAAAAAAAGGEEGGRSSVQSAPAGWGHPETPGSTVTWEGLAEAEGEGEGGGGGSSGGGGGGSGGGGGGRVSWPEDAPSYQEAFTVDQSRRTYRTGVVAERGGGGGPVGGGDRRAGPGAGAGGRAPPPPTGEFAVSGLTEDGFPIGPLGYSTAGNTRMSSLTAPASELFGTAAGAGGGGWGQGTGRGTLTSTLGGGGGGGGFSRRASCSSAGRLQGVLEGSYESRSRPPATASGWPGYSRTIRPADQYVDTSEGPRKVVRVLEHTGAVVNANSMTNNAIFGLGSDTFSYSDNLPDDSLQQPGATAESQPHLYSQTFEDRTRNIFAAISPAPSPLVKDKHSYQYGLGTNRKISVGSPVVVVKKIISS